MKKLTKLVLALSLVALCTAGKKPAADVIHFSDWKFKTGDQAEWAQPNFDDSKWETIRTDKNWELQGHKDYDGYAWYRIRFMLPTQLKTNALFKEALLINLGKIDDADETYLNGKVIGRNGKTVKKGDNSKFDNGTYAYNELRLYQLPLNDERIIWGKINTLAVRVKDYSGAGGMYSPNLYVTLSGLNELMRLNYNKSGVAFSQNKLSKTISLENKSKSTTITGTLNVEVTDIESGKICFSKNWNVSSQPQTNSEYNFELNKSPENQLVAHYTFTETQTKSKMERSEEFPYILTPKPSNSPQINGAKVVGVRPGSPFLFRIPATGVRPMTFTASNLPQGLQLDSNTGILTGSVSTAGEYIVGLKAQNNYGTYSRNLKIKVGNALALTPPMGWNSWNVWGLAVDNDKVKAAADAFISSGLADCGYTYVNIDDGWEAPARGVNGEILTNEKFPDMKATSDYVHSKGLRFGIYSSPGPQTCGGYLGSYQHELQDAETYAKWGVDYLKYDWCSYGEICPDSKSLAEQQKPYIHMSKCLQQQNRDIVHSLCQYGMAEVWKWGGSIGGQLWRTTGDITDTWESLKNIGFQQYIPAPNAKPGNWNDPDMLIVGWVGWGPSLHPTRLTPSEQYTHISLWAMLSAPLLIGCDLTRLDDFTLNLLTNTEVIDIDQDPLGKSALPVVQTADNQIWVKDLEDGSKAIAIFNLDNKTKQIKVDLNITQLNGKLKLRDVWRQKDLGEYEKTFTTNVQAHGVTLVRAILPK